MNAFEVVPLVALGEVHMLREEADLLTELVTTPAFPDRVDAIVVEFGNALYQSTIDRYVEGEPVGRDELRRVWAETVGGMHSRVFESPIYEEFFVTVRQRNRRLSRDRRIRVLLGDPPFDPRGSGDQTELWQAIEKRDDHFASVVVEEFWPGAAGR